MANQYYCEIGTDTEDFVSTYYHGDKISIEGTQGEYEFLIALSFKDAVKLANEILELANK
jgi:hypothetical protein